MKQPAINSCSSLHLFSLCAMLCLLMIAPAVSAASWNGIEPFKSKRADVIRILGQPVGETAEGVLRFKVMGGSVQISFINEQFVAAKKLRPDLAGTVLEIVLEHEHSSDTPESLKLVDNHSFKRDDLKDEIIFRNLKEGIVYIFNGGKLKSTRYTFADTQLGRARR